MITLRNSKINSLILSIILITGILFQSHFLYHGTFSQYAHGEAIKRVLKAGEIAKPNATGIPDDPSLKITWLQTRGDKVDMNLTNSNKSIIFKAPTRPYSQELEFNVRIASEKGNQSGIVKYAVESNVPPTANAGIDRVISTAEICNSQNQNGNGNTSSATSIILDGRNSTDDDPESLKYEWTQIAGPVISIDNNNNKLASFEINLCQLQQDTTLVFNLIVRDRIAQDFDNTTMVIDVEKVPEKRPLDPYSSETIISGLSQARELYKEIQPSNMRFNGLIPP